MNLEGFFEEHPTKPGGGRWRTVELEVALARARARTWSSIAEQTGFKVATLQSYTRREWWDAAYMWCVRALADERNAEQEREAREARESWQREDAELKKVGIKLALTALIETLQGKRPRDEVQFRRLLDDGLTVAAAEYKARMSGKMPMPSDRVWAAKELLKAVGYTTSNDELARLAIEQERKARELVGGAEGVDINVELGTELDEGGA